MPRQTREYTYPLRGVKWPVDPSPTIQGRSPPEGSPDGRIRMVSLDQGRFDLSPVSSGRGLKQASVTPRLPGAGTESVAIRRFEPTPDSSRNAASDVEFGIAPMG